MRKISLLSIATIYLLLSVGVNKSTHYCMGRVVDVAYFSSLADGCLPNDERKMPCCEDTLEVISLESEHQASLFIKSFVNSFEVFVPEYFQLEYNSLLNQTDESFLSVIPPPPILYDNPLYKKQHQFTFYG